MAYWLVHWTSDQAVQVWAWSGHCVMFFGQDSTLTVPLSTGLYLLLQVKSWSQSQWTNKKLISCWKLAVSAWVCFFHLRGILTVPVIYDFKLGSCRGIYEELQIGKMSGQWNVSKGFNLSQCFRPSNYLWSLEPQISRGQLCSSKSLYPPLQKACTCKIQSMNFDPQPNFLLQSYTWRTSRFWRL